MNKLKHKKVHSILCTEVICLGNIICCIIFGFFVILGVSELITAIVFHFFKTTTTPETICAETIEYVLRSNLFLNQSNKHSPSARIIVDENNDKEVTKIYKIFISK